MSTDDTVQQRPLAASILLLLQQDPRRYLNFGAYWWLVKAWLKTFYSRDNLSLLGDYQSADAGEHMPAHDNLDDALRAALDEYNTNVQFNLGSDQVCSAGGGVYRLVDTDAGPAGS